MQTRTKWLAVSTATLLALSTPAMAGSDTYETMQEGAKSTQQSQGDVVLQGEGGQPKGDALEPSGVLKQGGGSAPMGDDVEATGVVEQGGTKLPPSSDASEY